jgi:hypothetical protein
MGLAAKQANRYPEIEGKLRPLALPLEKPGPGDWLAEHRERGQTFRQYLSANPVRRGNGLNAIYLCLLGDFTEPQERILERAGEYLGLCFDVPVHVRCRIPLSAIPAHARRRRSRRTMERAVTLAMPSIAWPVCLYVQFARSRAGEYPRREEPRGGHSVC